MLLSTGHRGQTILSCNLTHVHVGHNKIVFLVDKLLKTSKPGSHISEVSLCSYSDTNLCPVVYLKEYIKRTRKIRQSSQLFVKLSKPHDKISRATLRRWTKTTLTLAGIDTNKYKAHSTRAAATSQAAERGVGVNTIMQSAGWKSQSTFAQFYKRPIKHNDTFSNAVLRVTP